jgi:hypothetical protein
VSRWEPSFWVCLAVAIGVPARQWWRKGNDVADHLLAAAVVVCVLGIAMASPFFAERADSVAPVSQASMREIGGSLVAGSIVAFLFVLLERSLEKARDAEASRLEFRRTVAMTDGFVGLDGRLAAH